MPTSYKPIKDHKPLNLNEEIARLEEWLQVNFLKLIAIARGDSPLEEDEVEELRGQFFRILFQFSAACAARPIRSPKRLVGTLRDIERRPQGLILNHTQYDPEAVDRLLRYYGGIEVALFEIGKASLIPSEVCLAAAFAIHEIEQQLSNEKQEGRPRRGRPEDDVLINFAFRASILFQASGGKPTNTKNGPFWRFVELLREVVKDVARDAGSSLSVESVVKKGAI